MKQIICMLVCMLMIITCFGNIFGLIDNVKADIGDEIASYNKPFNNAPTGITWDGSNLWVAEFVSSNNNDKIHKLDENCLFI